MSNERASAPSPETPPGALYRLAWSFYLLLAVGGAVWIGVQRGSISLDLFVDADSWWLDTALGLGTGGLLLGLWELSRRRLATMRALEEQLRRMLGGLDASEALALAVLSGFAEELFFRGAMQPAWGWGWATLIFTLLHTGPGRSYRVWTAFAAFAGIAFALTTEWRGNLLPAVVAHVTVNAVNLRRLSS